MESNTYYYIISFIIHHTLAFSFTHPSAFDSHISPYTVEQTILQMNCVMSFLEMF